MSASGAIEGAAAASPERARSERIAAVGAGRMGRGIAIAFAYGGYRVDVVDFKPRGDGEWQRLAADAHGEIESSLRMLAELGAMPADAIERVVARIRLVPHSNAADALAAADVVFEGVTETLDAKRDAFARLCRVCRSDAILASTTSTILVTDLVPLVTQPQRLVNAHWLNPAYVIPLVELSAHERTDAGVLERLRALLEDIGKVPVLCGPAPGYIVPRLQALMMNEAARMVEEGIATAEEIDKATRYGLGLRFAAIGVVEFIDFGGNDILFHASRYLADAVSRERYAAPAIVERMMHEGRNGLRSGAGFYRYDAGDVAAYRKDVLARTLGMLRHAGLQRPPR
ncbi:MAG TPA: 3-hydroxybutyryl-CoA dehydrogenase [Burkholderiaceae bacterium]|nr:3-hydroxybutyryl-CoA dehydrogenase [Burkholderiaceae bacterium]